MSQILQFPKNPEAARRKLEAIHNQGKRVKYVSGPKYRPTNSPNDDGPRAA